MKSISLDDKEGIIVFSKEQERVDCVFLCNDDEFAGITTTEVCMSCCPTYLMCEQFRKMYKLKEQAPYKENNQ